MSPDEAPEQSAPLDVGFWSDEPREVHHQYEFDRLFREYHSARDNEVAIRKGRALISTLMRWIRAGEPFTADDLVNAKKALADGKVTIKTSVQQQGLGTVDEHYKVTWDSYTMHVREGALAETYDFARKEALDVKLDAQGEIISILMAICDERQVLVRDYKVGSSESDSLKRRATHER